MQTPSDLLNITPLKAFDDNYIWCIEAAGELGFVVVDPGDAQVVQEHAKQSNKSLAAILVTHHHDDHTGGVNALIEAYGPIPVYGPSNSPYANISHPLQQDQQVEVLGQTFEIMEIPGHTLDHIAYYNAEQGLLFCGDTLFLAGCGRVFEGTPEQMHHSLSKIMDLPAITKAYPTHEYSLANLAFALAVDANNDALQLAYTTCQETRAKGQPTLPTHLSQEAAINPFVRTQDINVVASASKYADGPLHTPAEVFASLRSWKNTF